MSRTRSERLVAANEAASDAFHGWVTHAAWYLHKRNLDEYIVDKYEIGYAPPSYSTSHIGGSASELIEANIFRRHQHRAWTYPFFRNRLMFPIRNIMGELVAFSGRDMSGDPKAPKYVNSPETEIWRKREALYGIHLAYPHIRETGVAVLVEGQLDVIRLHAKGVPEAVSPCGTAFTPQQAALIRALCKRAVVLFDSDEAGIRESSKASKILRGMGVKTLDIHTPSGKDPDEYLIDGKADFVWEAIRELKG